MSSDVEHTTTRRTSRRRSRGGIGGMIVPFIGLIMVGCCVVPGISTVTYVVGIYQTVLGSILEMGWVITGATIAVFAVGIGAMVVQRMNFYTWHVAATALGTGVVCGLTTAIGWQPWWIGVHFFLSLIGAGSWSLYRIDVFRAAARGEAGSDGWGEVLKLPARARARARDAVSDDVAVSVPIDHVGVPLKELRDSIPRIDSMPGIIPGKTTITQVGDTGGQAMLRMVHTDPHKHWRAWPGLTHPGGSFSAPISTGYYSTGERQWFSFTVTPAGFQSTMCPDFRSPNDTFVGRQGMTGAGKSGDAAVEQAEVFSRYNVVTAYIDLAKFGQNASWCWDFCTLAVSREVVSRALWRKLRKVGEYRSKVLGRAGFRNYVDEAYEVTGLAWFYIFADEFDIVANSADVEWMATKGRSLGFRFSFTLPRAIGAKMSTEVRGAVGTWRQFGITQDYDKGFVLDKETIEAGANPEKYGATVPGLHWLDRAPGVDPKLYPLDCRTFKTREDYSDLRAAVEAARAGFEPATLTPEEIRILGEVWGWAQPAAAIEGATGLDDDSDGQAAQPAQQNGAAQPAPDGKAAAGQPAAADTEGDEMPGTTAEAVEAAQNAPSLDLSQLRQQYGEAVNPRVPIARRTDGPGVELVADKPEPRDQEHAVAEFDAALLRMYRRGVEEFGNADVAAECAVMLAAPWLSKRFKGLCDLGEYVPPDGVSLSRLGRGRYRFDGLGVNGASRVAGRN
jgi:hypothetical protein